MKAATEQKKAPKLNVRLLRKVQKHILEEPRRFYMGWVLSDFAPFADKPMPPCGTTGCIAGWACALSGEKENADLHRAADLLGVEYLLGSFRDQASRLFFEDYWPTRFRDRYDRAHKARSQARMAKAASARIDHFIKTKGAE